MRQYIAMRLLATIPVAIGVATIVFIVIRLSGDPVDLMLGSDAPREAREALRQRLGLDAPLTVQYVRWFASVAQGDLGTSLVSDEPVAAVIQRSVGPTLLLTVASLTLATVLGVTLGVLAAMRSGSLLDRLSTLMATLGVSMPTFWLGLVLVAVFAVELGWLPTGGMVSPRSPSLSDIPKHLVLPALTLALPAVAVIARLTRSSMLEVIGQDYVRTARAKGLRERGVILTHALKNALIPVVTIVGLQFGQLLGGAIIVEVIFSWPGVGSLMLSGINRRDFPLVQGTVLSVAMAFVLVTLAVDLLYGYLNPRIRYRA